MRKVRGGGREETCNVRCWEVGMKEGTRNADKMRVTPSRVLTVVDYYTPA